MIKNIGLLRNDKKLRFFVHFVTPYSAIAYYVAMIFSVSLVNDILRI